MARFLSTMLVGAGLCWLLCGNLTRPATADPTKEESRSESLRIAVVDIGRIFTTSKSFKNERAAQSTKNSEAEETGRQMIKEIQQLTQQWMGLDPGSEERKDLEIRIKRKQAEYTEYQKVTTRKLQREEAAIYVKYYQKVAPEIANYAQAHGIDLVIRHQTEPVNEDDPMKLVQSMNRMVIYENKLDITDDIIAVMSDL